MKQKLTYWRYRAFYDRNSNYKSLEDICSDLNRENFIINSITITEWNSGCSEARKAIILCCEPTSLKDKSFINR